MTPPSLHTASLPDPDAIVLVCAADENYAMPLGTMLYSVLANLREARHLEIFILDGGLTRDSQARIDRILQRHTPSALNLTRH